MSNRPRVAVVIPCYKVTRHILGVIAGIGPAVSHILVVDDHCPDGSGHLVETGCRDPRVVVIYRAKNGGVSAATMTGYRHAYRMGVEVAIKMDGDGQMDPADIPRLIAPILEGRADYVKGNRFFDFDHVRAMPTLRLLGNAGLSFLTKISSGYWGTFDPVNGFTALAMPLVPWLPANKIAPRYFFESDLLFRLYLMRAVVLDMPQMAHYGDEVSGVRLGSAFIEFLKKNLRNTAKRIVYCYFLREVNVATLALLLGLTGLIGGGLFGTAKWIEGVHQGIPSSSGTVMLAALPVMLGVLMLQSFLSYDINNVPRQPVHPLLMPRPLPEGEDGRIVVLTEQDMKSTE